MSIPIIIIAAGKSARLGSPKQLIKISKETLLNNTIKKASFVSNNILVILGAKCLEITKTITNKSVKIVYNENWPDGMASSIKLGVLHFIDVPKLIISVCDQPYLTTEIFERLISFSNLTNKPIIASNYGPHIGVPMLFNNQIFDDLLGLKGDIGAKAILDKYAGSIGEIDFPNGDIDIDTKEDLAIMGILNKKSPKKGFKNN